MTGVPDGDVDRALASIDATPLKYHSFGVVSVRPPGADPAAAAAFAGKRPASDGYGAATSALPPTGEGTTGRYRAHAVSTVFPLLGLALPEAFQIDVEPVWPVGPPVSDQGILLDRPLPDHKYPAHRSADQKSGAPPGYAPMGHGSGYGTGVSNAWPQTPPAFNMPPWLDPLPPTNPLHKLPDVPVSSIDPHGNFPAWDAAAMEPPVKRPPDVAPVRRLNTWGEQGPGNRGTGDQGTGNGAAGEVRAGNEPIGNDPFGERFSQPHLDHQPHPVEHGQAVAPTEFSPFAHNGFGRNVDRPASEVSAQSWLNDANSAASERHTGPAISDWTAPIADVAAAHGAPAHSAPHGTESAFHETLRHDGAGAHGTADPLPDFPASDLLPPAPAHLGPLDFIDSRLPEPWERHPEPPAAPAFREEPTRTDPHHSLFSDGAPIDQPPEPPQRQDGSSAFYAADHDLTAFADAPLHSQAAHDPAGYQPPNHDPEPAAPDPFSPSRFQPIDAEPTWHDAPAVHHSFTGPLHLPAAEPLAAREPPLTHPPAGALPGGTSATSAKGRPLADMFRTLSTGQGAAGAPRSSTGAP